MRISTLAVLLTATFAGLGVALPGEEAFQHVQRSTPDAIPPRPRPRPIPPPPGPPPDRPLPPIPRPLPDAVSRPRYYQKREPESDFEIYARALAEDLEGLYERDAGEDFEFYERDLEEDFGMYERDLGEEYMDWE